MSVNDISKIIIDDSRVMIQIVASLTDYSRGVIYNCIMFIIRPLSWRHDIQHNDTQHNDTQHNDTQHRGLIVTLSINDIQQKRLSA
jgi:hypothetical protein